MKTRSYRSCQLGLYLSFLLASAAAQSLPPLPKIQGETLNKHQIVLPAAASGKVAVLVFGFTDKSKKQTTEWGKEISKQFAEQKDFELYQLPVLEDVPRLIRGMVISGIRKGVPENERDHFVIVLQGEDDLKTLVGYKEEDDAYLVILDRSGNIARQRHGAPTADAVSQLNADVAALLRPAR